MVSFMQNNFFLATIIKNKPDGDHQEKNLDQNDRTHTYRYKMAWATDTGDFSFYTAAATFTTKHPLLDLAHQHKERQAWFGGMATGYLAAGLALIRLEGTTAGHQSEPCVPPHRHNHPVPLQRDVTHHTLLPPRTKRGPNWRAEVLAWVDGGFETTQVPP